MRVVAPLSNVEIIARGREIRVLKRLYDRYGKGIWRKLKADTAVLLPDGRRRRAEVHFYEAHGIGRRGFKVKRYLD